MLEIIIAGVVIGWRSNLSEGLYNYILLRRVMLSARRIPLARIKSYSLLMCRQIYVVLCMRYFLCSHQLNVDGKHSLLSGKYMTNIRKKSHDSIFQQDFLIYF